METSVSGTCVTARSKPFQFGHLPQDWNEQGLHKGVDIEGAEGDPVFVVAAGVPSESFPGDPWSYSISIRHDQDLVSSYTHLNPASVPQEVKDAIKNQTKIAKGTLVGRLAAGAGGNKSHVHFSIEDCARGLHVNPLQFMGISDTIAPQIFEIYVKPLSEAPLKKSDAQSKTISGKAEIIFEVGDRIDHQPRLFPPNKLEYEIIGPSGIDVVPRTVLFDGTYWKMNPTFQKDACLRGEGATEYIGSGDRLYYFNFDPSDFNISDTSTGHEGNWLMALTDSGFGPVYVLPYQGVTQQLKGGWDVGTCESQTSPNGIYKIRITATDLAGNSATQVKSIAVANPKCTQ